MANILQPLSFVQFSTSSNHLYAMDREGRIWYRDLLPYRTFSTIAPTKKEEEDKREGAIWKPLDMIGRLPIEGPVEEVEAKPADPSVVVEPKVEAKPDNSSNEYGGIELTCSVRHTMTADYRRSWELKSGDPNSNCALHLHNAKNSKECGFSCCAKLFTGSATSPTSTKTDEVKATSIAKSSGHFKWCYKAHQLNTDSSIHQTWESTDSLTNQIKHIHSKDDYNKCGCEDCYKLFGTDKPIVATSSDEDEIEITRECTMGHGMKMGKECENGQYTDGGICHTHTETDALACSCYRCKTLFAPEPSSINNQTKALGNKFKRLECSGGKATYGMVRHELHKHDLYDASKCMFECCQKLFHQSV